MSSKKVSETKCTATLLLVVKGHGYPTQVFSDPVEIKSDPLTVSPHDHIRSTATKAYEKLLERLPKL